MKIANVLKIKNIAFSILIKGLIYGVCKMYIPFFENVPGGNCYAEQVFGTNYGTNTVLRISPEAKYGKTKNYFLFEWQIYKFLHFIF